MVLINIITDAFERGWANFLARPQGAMNFRFIIQPTLAAILGIRAGIADAKKGQPAFLWSAVKNSSMRPQLLKSAWKGVRIPILIGVTLDAIYEVVVLKNFYLLELLFTVTLLVIIPYFIVRGPANRIARIFITKGEENKSVTTNKE